MIHIFKNAKRRENGSQLCGTQLVPLNCDIQLVLLLHKLFFLFAWFLNVARERDFFFIQRLWATVDRLFWFLNGEDF